MFDAIYSRSLVYNTCWEDPAVDRQALQLTPQDTLLVITSAGCNTLDYALQGPARVHAVDANPRQTALLELKLAGIRSLDFDDFFLLFGHGRHPHFEELYRDVLRAGCRRSPTLLGPQRRLVQPVRCPRHVLLLRLVGYGSAWFPCLSGDAAEAARRHRGDVRGALAGGAVRDLRQPHRAAHVEQGHELDAVAPAHHEHAGRAASQRREVERQHPLGVAGFIREAIEYVARNLPFWTNYFWALYLRGSYTHACCPEYLKRENFLALKAGLVDRVRAHTTTVTEFLHGTQERISRFVLLDHMDWMSSYYPQALVEEWNAILARAAAGARVIFRSAHAWPAYLEHVRVGNGERVRRLMEVLEFHPELAQALTREDRVHTYAGFHIADVRS